ncbi:MAG: hypothetical protein FWC47_04475 [Oscillospiraceae bacterium]|nr:hypothetical protein [Oscillospiraceae bacterium]
MSCELVNAIKKNTEILFKNANIMLQTCNLNFILCDLPAWKHVYHQFHSLDQWFINPSQYIEPDFHEPGLNSLNEMSKKVLSKEDLEQYLEKIRIKIMKYLDSLTDDMLYEVPQGFNDNKLSLIISQHRHFYAHLGNINATTIIETNKWPRVIGITGSSEGFYE